MIFGSDHRDKTEHPGPFSGFAPPPAPDYARPDAWAAHPVHHPIRHWPSRVPSMPVSPEQQPHPHPVHTFFIHPTTFRGLGVGWNAAWDHPEIAAITDEWPMRHQASLFRRWAWR